ncbi:MAG: class I SAM-dependent methyltransferase [Halieaceae bacterium]|nr:class I SAM-dependent methyltransferase [Halieaceae bacterium]
MITWLNESRIEVNGTRFGLAKLGAPQSKILHIIKEPFHINFYAELASDLGPGSNIVELGIRWGASTAFLAVLFEPRLLSAFEIAEKASDNFDQFLASHPIASRVRAHFNCDQADAIKLTNILRQDFEQEPLDLVIDDASHLLGPTLTSFNILFPRLRPGGIFVIEDWSWEHYSEGRPGFDFVDDMVTDFARLVLIASLVSAHQPDIISKIVLMRGIAVIYRGTAELDPEGFEIDKLMGERGRQLLDP